MREPEIEIRSVCKAYTVDNKENAVIRNLNMQIEPHKFVSILGFTGCGKSTLLRIICGLEPVDEGEVLVRGKRVSAPSKSTVLIYQDLDQLFPWKTAANNISYVIRKTNPGMDRKEAQDQARELLSRVGLEEYESYYPSQMSGGMRQRCAVARAIAAKPQILLMDEPFSALDEVSRRKLQKLCRDLFEGSNLTILFVTHSVDEAITLSDEIIVMGKTEGNILEKIDNTYRVGATEKERINMRMKIMACMNSEIQK